MEKIKIKWLNSPISAASQIYDSGLEYCLINKEHEQCHPFVFCKDFMQDAIHGYLNNKKASIYGFNYNPDKMPKLSFDKTRLIIANSGDKKFSERVLGIVDLLNQFEDKLKLKSTTLQSVLNPLKKYTKNGMFYLDGSSQWLNSPVMISLYSLMIRIGCSHKIGTDFMTTIKGVISGAIPQYQSNDKIQLSQSMVGIEKLLESGYRKFFFIETLKNYPSKVDISTMHNGAGIVSWSRGNTKNICPYWTRKIKRPIKGVGTTTNFTMER